MIKKFLIAVLLMTGMMKPALTEAQSLTINQCREKALKYNAAMMMAKGNVESARHDKSQAYTMFFPKIEASVEAFKSTDNLIEIDMQKELNYKYVGDNYGWSAGVTAILPIYTGGQISNNYKMSELGMEVRQLEKAMTRKDVILNSDRLFWQVVKYRQQLITVNNADTLLAEVERVTRSIVNNGMRNQNDLLQVQLRRNENRSIASRLKNAIEVSRMMLSQYIGMGDTLVDVNSTVIANNDTVVNTSNVNTTTDYALLQKQVKVAELEVDLERGKLLPQLSIGASFSADHLMGYSHGGVGFVTLSIPISDWWGGSHAVKSKQIKLQNARYDFIDKSQKIDIHLKSLRLNMTEARNQIDIASKSIDQARESLRLNSSTYKAGTTLMSDFLSAQNALLQAETNYINAQADYNFKVSEYEQAIK
jgi:outer membrane protein TolC